MNPRINQLVRTLLKKESLDQCSLPELQEFADRHPYFGAAQLLLTKKMQQDKPDQYNEQLQKTFLFFHNPLWVEHLLNENGNAEIVTSKKDEPVNVAEEVTHFPTKEERLNNGTPEEPVVVAEESTIFEEKTATDLALLDTAEPDPALADKVIDERSAPVALPVAAEPLPASEEKAIEQNNVSISETSTVTEKPVTVKEELAFEPFHTVDYFASQGIKLKDDEKPKDKFGQQLKSFTEWLKTMKRFPVTEVAQRTEPVAEKKVEEMAQHSLEDREVVTEAMAEVWEKQGNTIKAIDIYSKLSLLEPGKSAYFAAKIDTLKKLN